MGGEDMKTARYFALAAAAAVIARMLEAGARRYPPDPMRRMKSILR